MQCYSVSFIIIGLDFDGNLAVPGTKEHTAISITENKEI